MRAQPVGQALAAWSAARGCRRGRRRGCSARAPCVKSGSKRSMCSPKSSPYWKSNIGLARALGGHRQSQAVSRASPRARSSRIARPRARPSPRGPLRRRPPGRGPRRSGAWRRRSSPSARGPVRPRCRRTSSETTRDGRTRVCRASGHILVAWPEYSTGGRLWAVSATWLARARPRGRVGTAAAGSLEWDHDVTRPRPVRRVQAVRVGGQPVHHRVPLLRSRLRRRAPKLPRAKGRDGLRAQRMACVGRAGAHALGAPLVAGAPAAHRRHGEIRARSARPYATIALVAPAAPGGCWCAGTSARSISRASVGIGQYVSFFRSRSAGHCMGDWWKLSHEPVRLRERAVRVRRAARDRDIRLAARAPPRTGDRARRCSSGARVTGALAASAVYAEPIVSGANGAALALHRRVGGPGPAGRASRALLRGRAARRRRDRRDPAAAALRPPEASWLAGCGIAARSRSALIGLGVRPASLIDPRELLTRSGLGHAPVLA